MSRVETTEEWILEDLAAITGKDIKDLRKPKLKSKSTPVNRHKYFRRPGKRHNNDFCYSCREGGTLICCDGCTKSFHLLCLDPPMEDEDIPEGEWLCKTCKINTKQLSENVYPKILSRKRKRIFDNADSEEVKLVRMVWKQLVKKAIESDPKEYENPLDCRTIPYIFPGDSKNIKKSYIKPKHPHSSQCYICSKGLSKQSMVNCDYCERSFHLDCTDPPLAVPPKHFWMCQFHIEPCLERIFYQEEMPSLSQRIALWDMCRKPIDHEAVKLEFLRNTIEDSSKIIHLPTIPIDIPDAVYNHYNNRPDMIPSLKEALRLVGYEESIDHIQKLASKQIKFANLSHEPYEKTSKEDQELWLATILGFQKDLISKMSDETKSKFIKVKDDDLIQPVEEIEIIEPENKIIDKEEVTNSCENSNLSDTSSLNKIENNKQIKRPHDEITKILQAAVSELPEADECLNLMNYLDDEFINVLAFQRLCQLMNYNKIFGKLMETNPMYKVENKDTKNLTNLELERFIGNELEKTVKHSDILCDEEKANETNDILTICEGETFVKINEDDFKLTLEDKNTVNVITPDEVKIEENDQMVSGQDGKDINIIKKEFIIDVDDKSNIDINFKDDSIVLETDSVDPGYKISEHDRKYMKFPLKSCIDSMPDTQILAVLTGIDKQCQLFPIYKSGYVIGTGSCVNLDLNKCGSCNFISKQHAVIFFDARSHLWEIINYSRYGCRVNNTLINFDVPKKALQNIFDSDSEEEICEFHESIRTVTKEQSERLDSMLEMKEKQDSIEKFYENPCNCNPKDMMSNMSSNGWNNSMPFSHGSLLQFGCIRLLFGDTSYVKK